jgi:ketosteroid isomerase-like protein
MKRLLIPLTALVLVACNQAGEPKIETASASSFNLAAARDSIIAANNRLAAAIGAGDSTAVASFYTSDAKLMASNMPAFSGTAAITSFAAEAFKMGIKHIKFDILDVWGSKELVGEEGIYTITDDKGGTVDKGKYLVFWKQEDGKWKLFRDIFNSDMPPAPMQPSDRRR